MFQKSQQSPMTKISGREQNFRRRKNFSRKRPKSEKYFSAAKSWSEYLSLISNSLVFSFIAKSVVARFFTPGEQE